jgi:hypothetical protein
MIFKLLKDKIFKKSNKGQNENNLTLDREMIKVISKNDWPDYDFRFKKENIIIVYGWDKYCFQK